MPKPQPAADTYRADLAFIHDAGFGSVASAAATELIERLRASGITGGHIVDLGCGSGITARALTAAGYDVTGFDISPAMLKLARQLAPRARFRQASFLAAELPACVAVAAVGEIFNYLFDRRHSDTRLWRFFRRAHAALQPGGLFLFDVAAPGRAGPRGQRRNFTTAADWACLYAAAEDRRRRTLTREITSFRRVGRHFRRDHEVHRLRLYRPAEVLSHLRAAGFRARTLRGYGPLQFPPGWVGFVARKT